jgi:hypothetical protein
MEAPLGKRDTVAKAAEFFHISPEPFDLLLDLRHGNAPPRDFNFVNLLDDYMKQVSMVIDAVDHLEK